jgi:hypothetical protein
MRDWLVPLVGLIILLFLGIKAPWYIHLISYGLYGAALTTYWDEIFNYDNFYLHGFVCALAYLPYAIVNHFWLGFGLRCIVCAVVMGLVNYLVNNFYVPKRDWIEELSRGFILSISLLLFLL